MLDPWNDLSLLAPPVNMFLCKKKFDLSALKHVCNNIIKVLSRQSPLHKESALCSRFLYKYDLKFRNDIGYRNLKKVHTALKKYLSLNFLKDIENFQSGLPSEDDDEIYLPTRQMLEYIMLRIITFSMIMLRICVCSKQAAIFYLNRIKRGEAHWMSLLPYALLSRLWSITLVLCQHSITWYSNLYPYLNKLEVKGLNFLPDNYGLPDNLEQLLDFKNIDCFGKFDWDEKKFRDMDSDLLHGDNENDLFDNILSFIHQSSKNESDDEMEAILPVNTHTEDSLGKVSLVADIDHGQKLSWSSYKADQGTIISREYFNKDQGEALSRKSFIVLLNTQNKNAKENKTTKNKPTEQKQKGSDTNKISEESEHSPLRVTSATALKKFIDQEEKFRNESDSRSLTNHLSFMQWHALKNALHKLCDALTNRKIQRKFQKIWQEKCVAYK